MSVEGIRKAVLGMEPYVPGKTIEEVRRELGLDRIVKLGSNENPYAPFPASAAAMRDEIENINRYPDIAFEEIKELLAGIHGVDPKNIAISHGAEGMLQAMAKCFLEPGDEVLLPSATYSLYRELSKLMGGRIVDVPLKDHTLDLEAVSDAATERAKLVWLCNPNNPTGTVFHPGLLDGLLDSLPSTAWVVLDEAYAEFAEQDLLPDRARLVSGGRNVISIRTFSKAYGLAGARIGYAIAREEVITAIDTVSEPFNANRVGIAGAVAVLTLDREACERARQMIISDRGKTSDALKEMGLEVAPSHTNFIFFETPFPADAVAEDLLKQGIIVRPCGGWGYDRAIRVTIGTGEENSAFLAALGRTIEQMKYRTGESPGKPAKEVAHGYLR
ncbi:MAG TPA: histidinol-phosphate transaminase [Synergistales bacterium]|jgi:histidinol-phosphate aminotransferase|nr:histidinol-phosphate transaminase [Synergistales bacterium]HRV71467.1 histidinol-phosphate transaminase [Thermovirgaceae bacterium]